MLPLLWQKCTYGMAWASCCNVSFSGGVTAEPYSLAIGLRESVTPSWLSQFHPEEFPLHSGLILLGLGDVTCHGQGTRSGFEPLCLLWSTFLFGTLPTLHNQYEIFVHRLLVK